MGFFDRLFGAEKFSGPFTTGDPDGAFAEWLKVQGFEWTGAGTDASALGLSAVYRAVNIVSGTIAGLPLKVYRKDKDGHRTEVKSWLSSSPAGPYDMSAFNWTETIVLHLLMRGESFLAHVFNGAGAVVGALPIHPQAITKVEWVGADKQFTVSLDDGTEKTFTSLDMTHIVGLSVDGLRGSSPMELFRRGISTGIAQDIASNNAMVKGGGMLAGLVTPEADITEADAATIKTGLDAKMADTAGGWAVVNRALKFHPLQMSNQDAQWIEGRNFTVEDICRMFGGVPIHLMSVGGAVSNFGTGIAEQNAGLAKFSLMAFTSRMEEAFTRILPAPQFSEFEYAGLLQGTPKQEIELLIAQVGAGLLTKDEARAIMNLPPMTEAQKAESAPKPLTIPTLDGPSKAQEGE